MSYYGGWDMYNDDGLLPSQIPTNRLSHLLYAFANIAPNGTVIVGDPWADMQVTYDGDDPDEPVSETRLLVEI